MIDSSQLGHIFEENRDVLLKYLKNTLNCTKEDSEDILIDALLRFQKYYTPGRSPFSLLVQCCKSICHERRLRKQMHLRNMHRIPEPSDPGDPFYGSSEASERAQEVLRVLGGTEYHIYAQLALDGHGLKDIAELTGLSVAKVRGRLAKAASVVLDAIRKSAPQ